MQAGRSTQARQFGREEREGLMDEVFGGEVHVQRLASLTDGVDGVLHATSLGVRAMFADHFAAPWPSPPI